VTGGREGGLDKCDVTFFAVALVSLLSVIRKFPLFAQVKQSHRDTVASLLCGMERGYLYCSYFGMAGRFDPLENYG